MPYRQVGSICVVNADLKSISARGVEEPVAHHCAQGTRCHDRLGNETIYRAKNDRSVEGSTGYDLQGRIQSEGANEYSQPSKYRTLRFCQEPKAPIQHGLQRFLTRWRRS